MKTMKTAIRLTVAIGLAVFFVSAARLQAQDFTCTTNNGNVTITKYTGSGGAVTIPESINGLPVTSIGESAFRYCTGLTTVTIPDSVTSIGAYAFSWCSRLTSIAIPSSIASIEGSTFSYCTSLTSITIPDSVTSIGMGAFSGCTSLPYATWGNGAIFFGQKPCPEGSLTIPQTINGLPVISIGEDAFSKCTSLTSVAIPNSVTSIRGSAFSYCTSLTNLTMPESVTAIGSAAFSGCTSLTSITIPDSVTTIGTEAFSGCTNLTSVTIPEGATYIGLAAFGGCTSLANVTIPKTVTTIGSYAFSGCTSLTNVTIAAGVVFIGHTAFGGCTSLTSVTIPQSVTDLGNAFWGCTGLTVFTVDPLNPSYVSAEGVLFDKNRTTLVKYPAGKVGNYLIPNSVTRIDGWAFQDSTKLTNVTIPDSVTAIGYAAFWGCTSLASAYFEGNAPDSVGSDIFSPSWTEDGTSILVPVTVHYLPGTTGWGTTFGGCPTAQWLRPGPVILTTASSLGIKTNGFGFTVSWATNASVLVEASTSLSNPVWSPVVTNALTDGVFYFNDPQWESHSSRFYRIRSP